MKPVPAPHIAGKTEWERFDNALRKVLSARRVEEPKKSERGQQEPPSTRPSRQRNSR